MPYRLFKRQRSLWWARRALANGEWAMGHVCTTFAAAARFAGGPQRLLFAPRGVYACPPPPEQTAAHQMSLETAAAERFHELYPAGMPDASALPVPDFPIANIGDKVVKGPDASGGYVPAVDDVDFFEKLAPYDGA